MADRGPVPEAHQPELRSGSGSRQGILAELHYGVLVAEGRAVRAERLRRLYTRNAGDLAGLEGLLEVVPV